MNKLIEFKNVEKQYKMGESIIEAVNEVSFEINRGETVIILGASGAGKTTILNLLGGIDTVTSGEIIVDGEDITKLSEKKLTLYRRNKVGFVFQFYNLIGNLTALENVEFASDTVKNHLDAATILDQVGLAERSNNFPAQLSGGEQQRVAIARAVAKNPLLLLCDEPTGALDYATGKAVLKMLTEVSLRYHMTLIIITHNTALSDIGDKVIRMRSGKINEVSINKSKRDVMEVEW